MKGLRFHEDLHPGYGQYLDVRAVLHAERTAHQEILIFDTRRFGRVLALDGIVQTTERDNRFYHEQLVHVPMFAHGAARRVLIVGGGDGGCLREALRHDGARVTLVEIDEAVIRASRRFLPALSEGAFDDPRATVEIADGFDHVRGAGANYDIVLVDSPDPIGPARALFSGEFYAACRERLNPGGILAAQCGVPFVQPGELRIAARRLAGAFAHSGFYTVAVPAYTGGVMTLGWASGDMHPGRVEHETLAARFAAAGLETRYYTPEVHIASFALPPWIAELAGAR